MNLYTLDKGLNTGFDYTVSTPPTKELLNVSDIEDRMNLKDNDDPDVIQEQIIAIRVYLEKMLNMTLVSAKTIKAYWKTFAEVLPLPFHPVTSVTTVTRVAHSDGTETPLDPDEYWEEGVSKKAIHFKYLYSGYGMKVVYITGLTDPGLVALVKDAIKSEVIEWFHQKGNPDETQYVLGKIALSKLHILRSL